MIEYIGGWVVQL